MIEEGWSGSRVFRLRLVPCQTRFVKRGTVSAREMAMLGRRFLFTCVIAWISLWEISRVHAGDAVPVLVWDGPSGSASGVNPVNPLQKTSYSEFHEIITGKLGKSLPPVLLFVKDSLCVEDITLHRESLRAITRSSALTYLPAVERAFSVFEDLPLYNRTYEDDVDEVADGQLVIMPVTDLNAAAETYKSLKESNPNLYGALTGKSCVYGRSERVRRAAESDDSSELYILNGRILLYASERPYIKLPNSEKYVQLPKPTDSTSDSPLSLMLSFTMNITNIFKIDIKLQFLNTTAGYYTLKVLYRSNVVKSEETVLEPNYDVSFPTTFSYHCSPNIVFRNNDTSLMFTDFQVQIDAKTFGDAYDCIGFTTIPIWSGIFVTAILALIMIWALSMIMDIRTMDRFDDPKGKTIAISAQE